MKCLRCGGRTDVIESRRKRDNSVRRRRLCRACSARFSTLEASVDAATRSDRMEEREALERILRSALDKISGPELQAARKDPGVRAPESRAAAEARAAEIRAAAAAGKKPAQLAQEFNLSRQQIWNIVRRRSWA